jgi:hypothetical protein
LFLIIYYLIAIEPIIFTYWLYYFIRFYRVNKMDIFFSDSKTFFMDAMGILAGAGVLFYLVAPLFIKSVEKDEFEQDKEDGADSE